MSRRRSYIDTTVGALNDWRTRAACAGRPQDLQGDTQAARDLCRSCPVIRDCTRWVMTLPPRADPGEVVAGMTEKERNRVRAQARGIRGARTRYGTRPTPTENGSR
jgi:hypothetical protein